MFSLPKSTEVKKVIPKNAFEAYTNTKQKKIFTDKILRITWLNKLATDTTNLASKEIQEIQVFDIELKEKLNIKDILTIINKAIPYPIIFIVRFENLIYLSTSPKHKSPINEDNAIIDYTFNTDWMNLKEFNYSIELKSSIDWVYKNFCEQFIIQNIQTRSINELIDQQKQKDSLYKEIEKLKSAVANCKQFNKKVELNIKLMELENEFKLFGSIPQSV